MMKFWESMATGRRRGKVLLALIVLTLAVYGHMIFVSIPAVSARAGGMQILDLMPVGYSPAYAAQLFERLGEAGRRAYLTEQIPVDLLYPFLFGVTFAWLLLYLMWRVSPRRTWALGAAAMLLLAGLFDYAENAAIIAMLASYPDFSPGLVRWSSGFTIAKSCLTTLSVVLLLGVLAAAAVRRFSRSRHPAEAA